MSPAALADWLPGAREMVGTDATTSDDHKDCCASEQPRTRSTFFLAMLVDLPGKPCAKLVPAFSLEMLLGPVRLE